MVERDCYSVSEACQRLSIGRGTFYVLKKSGALRTFLVGRKRMVSNQAIQDFILKQEGESSD